MQGCSLTFDTLRQCQFLLSTSHNLCINISQRIYSSIRSFKRQVQLSKFPSIELFLLFFLIEMTNEFTIILASIFVDAPVCISSSVTIVGASIDESVAIPCRISADPSKVSFEWTFSNSGERYEVPSGHYTTIQSSNVDVDHIYLDADENGTNGNGTSIFPFSH